MSLIPLNLESLKELDAGKVSVAWDHELKRAVSDCMDRPGDKKPRVVTLELAITPVVSEDGGCEGAHGEFQIKSKVPTRKSRVYDFGVNRKGHVYFSDTSPDNLPQTTFDDVDPETGRVARKMKGSD